MANGVKPTEDLLNQLKWFVTIWITTSTQYTKGFGFIDVVGTNGSIAIEHRHEGNWRAVSYLVTFKNNSYNYPKTRKIMNRIMPGWLYKFSITCLCWYNQKFLFCEIIYCSLSLFWSCRSLKLKALCYYLTDLRATKREGAIREQACWCHPDSTNVDQHFKKGDMRASVHFTVSGRP